MVESIKLYLFGILKKSYVKVAFLLCGLPSFAIPFIEPLLPDKLREYNMIVILTLVIILLIIILIASFEKYHELRIAQLKELYKYDREVKSNRVFRIFYKLYRRGELIEAVSNNALPLQDWDNDVWEAMLKYCTEACMMNYLIATRRTPGSHIPINYTEQPMAVSYIKDILNNMFGYYFKK